MKNFKNYYIIYYNKKFPTEEKVAKHFLVCWKEKNPYHQSKEIIYSETIDTVEMNDDVKNFFNSFLE